ncbi:MAG TPA: hypothetical protein VND65_12590, partial [Candidatus Binatia bacterium]|nr:hypothetical protein [Candidatus Binatia bacterium]
MKQKSAIHHRLLATTLFLVAFTSFPLAQARKAAAKDTPQTAGTSGNVARGKYIVEGVAMCSMCHTPRLSNGDLDRDHWLDGAALWLQPSRAT